MARWTLRDAARWELLIMSLLFVGIYVARQTGTLSAPALRLLDDVLVAVVLALALRLSGVGRRTVVIHLAIAGLAVALAAIQVAVSGEWLIRISEVLSGYLIAVSGLLVFRLVSRPGRVAGDTLFGALVVYLAVGVLFGIVFTSIARNAPASFAPPQPVIDGETTMYYFSFVTLTGLGYGDITPTSDAARILATLESVTGVVLLAALVGRIVGLLVAQESDSLRNPIDPAPAGDDPGAR